MPTHALSRLLATVVGLALLLPTAGAEAAQQDGSPGSRGIGDPYYANYGNGGYDVDHYGIHVSYAPRTDRLTGSTRIRAHATQALTRFDLDFVLPVSRVWVNDRPATFRRDPHELVVTPSKALRAGQELTVRVRYSGVPSRRRPGGLRPWTRTPGGVVAAGKPEIAAWWYPSNDHPRDKATYDVRVTVAKRLEAVGNGVLVSRNVRHGRRTWHWRESDPMAPYLSFFAVGQYDLARTRAGGYPMVTAVASGGHREGRRAAAALARTPDVVAFGTREFGSYPFESIGGVAAPVRPGFAVESQTRPVYARAFWRGGPNVYVVVHQVAHQWFGDSVSVDSWPDIWLNEGFASYAEWRWSELHGGGSGRQLFRAAWDDHADDRAFWDVAIGDPGAHAESDIALLDRGAMTLQALRTRIGAPAFFTILRAWVAQHRHGNASTADFIALAEQESGADLGSFFEAWLDARERPAPTRGNGFPRGFEEQPTRPASVPPSWEEISRTHALLAARGPR
jgi:aminopeptidase N